MVNFYRAQIRLISLLLFIQFSWLHVLSTGPELPKSSRKLWEMMAADELWLQWKLAHNKIFYRFSVARRAYASWRENMELIADHNYRYSQGGFLYKKQLNWFADRKAARVLAQLTMTYPNFDHERIQPAMVNSESYVPPSVDWRDWEGMTGIQEEPLAQSFDPFFPGWLFAAVEVVQSQIFVQTRRQVILSLREVLDCMETFGYPHGSMVNVFSYIGNHGVSLRKDYPRKTQSQCWPSRRKPLKINIQNVFQIVPGDEEILKRVIALIGPVASKMFIGEDFVFYGSGIFEDQECSGDQPQPRRANHVALVVGYGQDKNGQKFWVLKNNWGPLWGEGGYMRIHRRTFANCGLAMGSFYPFIQKELILLPYTREVNPN